MGIFGAYSAHNWTKFWTKFQSTQPGSHYLIVENSAVCRFLSGPASHTIVPSQAVDSPCFPLPYPVSV